MRSWQIGDITVTSVVEVEGSAPGTFLFAEADGDTVRARHGWAEGTFVEDGRLLTRVQARVVESAGRTLVVDTCIGNDKERDVAAWNQLDLPFLERFAAAGFDRLTVDAVVCTHLHVDHVGWNTRRRDGSWVPTFEGARHLFARAEYEHWAEDTDEMSVAVQADSVDPLVHAGLVDLVEPDHAICDEVTLEATHGHTPGHVSVRVASRGASAVITGDMTHHPIQLTRPGICSSADVDPAASTRTRHEAFARRAEAGTLVIGSHYAQPSAGRLVEHEGGWRLS